MRIIYLLTSSLFLSLLPSISQGAETLMEPSYVGEINTNEESNTFGFYNNVPSHVAIDSTSDDIIKPCTENAGGLNYVGRIRKNPEKNTFGCTE